MIILANLSQEDRSHKFALGKVLRKHTIKVTYESLSQTSLLGLASKIEADAIILSNPATLANLVEGAANLSDWRGSVLKFSTPVLVINPLDHIYTTTYGEWLLRRDLLKLPTLHKPARKLAYKIIDNANELRLWFQRARAASAIIVCDIETTKSNLISMIGYTAISAGSFDTIIVPFLPSAQFEDLCSLVREFHAGENIFAFHNGSFDCYHLLRYHIPTNNYLLDTEYLWSCWETELPKSLGFLCSVFLYDQYFWKEEKERDEAEYCAKDCLATARCLLVMLKEAPQWALDNYIRKFPEVFCAIQTSFYGLKVDIEAHKGLRDAALEQIDKHKEALQKMTATAEFNPASAQQVSYFLYDIIGAVRPRRSKGKTATDEASLKKISIQHPLIERVVTELLAFREKQKALTTYYNAPLYHERLKFHHRIDGTVTSRWSASASTLYVPLEDARKKDDNYGTQVQNIPPYMKHCLVADEGYDLAEIDKEKSEAHIVAYLAQDEKLIAAIENKAIDFYCQLFEDLFNIRIEKGDARRQLMKRTVHGTNYVMGEDTFIDVNGITELQQYKSLLNFNGALKAFVKFLLSSYLEKYAGIKRWWQKTIVAITKNPYFTTPDGWTRHFHGPILKNTKIQRDAIAHQPQHLSVVPINKAMTRALGLYLSSEGEFIPLAQIHDSILFQSKEGTTQKYVATVKQYLDIPLMINGKELRIPTSAKMGKVWATLEELPHAD